MAEKTAIVGEIPTIIPDIPIAAVFIFLFVLLAPSHMFLFLRNRSNGKWFVFNAMTFGFGMSRIAACSLRIAWAVHPTNSNLTLASQVFLNAGILLIYIINFLFLVRLIRSAYPRIGWNRFFRIAYMGALWFCLPVILTLIVIIILAFKSPTATTLRAEPIALKIGTTYFLLIAASPLLCLPFLVFWPADKPHDAFGEKHIRTKARFLLITVCLATLEAGFRCGTAWSPARPATNPAWYDSKAAFYCFNFTIDALIMAVFLVGRIDLVFWVPDKSSRETGYARGTDPSSSNASVSDEEKAVHTTTPK